jgi:uncharacterized protein (DUF2126 family)
MNALLDIGSRADAQLGELGLTLTQGGEPTFVPRDTRAAEWNALALGPEKLPCARRFARHLLESYLPGAVVLLTAGKLYPGELLPRWNLGLYRSKEYPPLWRNLALLQLDQSPRPRRSPTEPRRLLQTLAKTLRLKAGPVPAFEDVAERMRREESRGHTSPFPRFSRHEARFVLTQQWTEADRARWKPFCEPVGWVLPLDYRKGRWESADWEFEEGRDLILIPGEGPLGLRLPLFRLKGDTLKRALTAELKDGELRLFLPPLPSLEAFVDLVCQVENLVSSQAFAPVTLEGYPPFSPQPNLESIGLAADPGVIEVNLPPSSTFATLNDLIPTVYRAAEAAGLRGFKYQLDGRKVSTGGGAHVLLGGPSWDQNPFLKRPDLLASFIRFFQHHPSLSYLFSGLFIGPSCQAPRPDELLSGVLPELELALVGLDRLPRPAKPEWIDRILRNLLLDWHGNTHRAEICVDKFYNVFLPNGCLGLVEFRAFEMTPDPDSLLAVNALLRALAAAFARAPYQKPLIAWGDQLHDQFLLPWFLETDLRRVLSWLRRHGFDFPDGLFQRHLDFRLPLLHRGRHARVRWELRQALEPWPVMGDQPGPVGTNSRPVDASTDRVQFTLHASAPVPPLLVNVNDVPLLLRKQAGSNWICGIRYRLFDNLAGLQPHLPAQSPLTFDFIHPKSGRIVESFQYREFERGHPSSKEPPLNDSEAQHRFHRRIVEMPLRRGDKPSTSTRRLRTGASTAYTLDLRTCSRQFKMGL